MAEVDTALTMNISPVTSIFHPSDFSEGDEAAFAHALRIALSAKGELDILHAGDSESDIAWEDFPSVRSILARWKLLPLNAPREALQHLGLKVTKVRRTGGDPVQTIVEYIQDHRPDLIVLASHQRQGFSRVLHQAIAEPLARQARMPTLFVPRSSLGFVSVETGEVRLENIVVPIDRAPRPRKALVAAASLAAALACLKVHFSVLYVGEEEDMPETKLDLRPGWTMENDCWAGPVVDRILKVCEDRNADLIVMATQGHNGFLDALRGSTTERVLRQSQCPLLAVPAS